MRHTMGKIALASTLGITGLGAGAVLVPALATAATSDQSTADAVGDRVDRITQALSGLVSDGTLTQNQADEVASTLNEELPRLGGGFGPDGGGFGGGGFGGHGMGTDAAATALGITQDELWTQLMDGKSLADIAQAEGVAVTDLVDAMVKAAEERLAQAVEDGRLTQAQADERKADLRAEVTERVDDSFKARGWHGPRGGFDGDADQRVSPTPSTSATPS